jgi:hypothetical protein
MELFLSPPAFYRGADKIHYRALTEPVNCTTGKAVYLFTRVYRASAHACVVIRALQATAIRSIRLAPLSQTIANQALPPVKPFQI